MKHINKTIFFVFLAVTLLDGAVHATEIRGAVAVGDFEWNPQNFAGFFYDIDKDLGMERIATHITYGNILQEPDGITYAATAQKDEFAFSPWGYYSSIGFYGQKWFAGYVNDEDTEDSNEILFRESTDENSMINEQLQGILIDSDEEFIVKSQMQLNLSEGYALIVRSMDEAGMLLDLTRDGMVVDSKVLAPFKEGATMADKTYVYKIDEGIQKGLAIIAVHFKSAVTIQNQTLATVDGIWQISGVPMEIKLDSQYDKMRIATVTSDTIIMDNKESSITLERNIDTVLMGDLRIRTADQDFVDDANPLRYYIYREDRCEC